MKPIKRVDERLKTKLLDIDEEEKFVQASIVGEVESLSPPTQTKASDKSKKFPWFIAFVFTFGIISPLALQSGLFQQMGNNIYTQKYGIKPLTNAMASSLGAGLGLFIAPYFGNIKNSIVVSKKSWFSSITKMMNINKYLLFFQILTLGINLLFWVPQLGSSYENVYYGILKTLKGPPKTIANNLGTAWIYSFFNDSNHLPIMFALVRIIPVIFAAFGEFLGPTMSKALSYSAYLSVNILISLLAIIFSIGALLYLNNIQVNIMKSNEPFSAEETRENNKDNLKEPIVCTLRRVINSPLFQCLLPVAFLAGYYTGAGPGSLLYTYFYQSIFATLEFKTIDLYSGYILILFLVGMTFGAALSSLFKKRFGERKSAVISLIICAILQIFQSISVSVKEAGLPQLRFMCISQLIQGFFLSNTSIQVASMMAICIDYEFLYSEVRKEAMFPTVFSLIQLLVSIVVSTCLLSILEILGYQTNSYSSNDDDFLNETPRQQSARVKIFLIILSNYALIILYLIACITLLKFPCGKKEYDSILKEIKKKEEETPDLYSFHDPIYPENSESNQPRVTFFTEDNKISVQQQKKMESFFYYFSNKEVQTLRDHTAGKHMVRRQFKIDFSLLIFYMLIFFSCMIVTLVENNPNEASVTLILLTISSFFTGYEVLRFPAMKALKDMEKEEIREHTKYCGKRRLIQPLEKVNECEKINGHILHHLVGSLFSIMVIVFASTPNQDI